MRGEVRALGDLHEGVDCLGHVTRRRAQRAQREAALGAVLADRDRAAQALSFGYVAGDAEIVHRLQQRGLPSRPAARHPRGQQQVIDPGAQSSVCDLVVRRGHDLGGKIVVGAGARGDPMRERRRAGCQSRRTPDAAHAAE